MRYRCWGVGCGRSLTSPGLCPSCRWRAEQIAANTAQVRDEPEEVPVDANRE
jgi:hypothetical protein